MSKAIVSSYFGRFVVCQARPLTRRTENGVDTIHRGYNFFGMDLGWTQRKKYIEEVCYIEGDALSRSYPTEGEAIAFAKENSLEIVPFREWSEHV